MKEITNKMILNKNDESWGGFKERLNRIRILVSMQLKTLRKKKYNTSGRLALSLVVSFVIITLITVLLYLIIKYASILFSIGFIISSDFLIVYITILQITSIIGCTIGLMQSLFMDSDNILLFSYPCRHNEVFLSKLIVYYLYELKKSLFGLLPLILVIGILTKESIYSTLPFVKINYFLWIPIIILILPVIPVIIGSLLSLPCSIIKRFIKSNPIIELIFVIVIVFLFYTLSIIAVNNMPDKIEVITQYSAFIEKIQLFVNKLSGYSLYYKFVVYILYNFKPLLNLLYILLIVVIGSTLVTIIIMPFYFSIQSHSMEESIEKKHKYKELNNKDIFYSFVKKEFLIKYRDIGKTVSSYSLLLALPSILIIVNGIYSRLLLNSSTAPVYVSFFITFIVILLSTSSNTDVSTSITEEGGEFVLLKSAPTKAENSTWAKIIVNFSFVFMISIIVFILLYIGLKITNAKYMINELFSLFIISLITNAAIVFKGMELDVRNPSLIEYQSTKSVKDNNNRKKVLEISLVLTIVYTLLFVILKMAIKIDSFIPLIALGALYLIYRVFIFKKVIFAFFDDIEL